VDRRIVGDIWRLLDIATNLGGQDAYNWGQVLRQMIPIDPRHAARLAVDALLLDHLDRDEEAKDILIEMTVLYSDAVMASLGAAILSDRATPFVYLGNYKDVIASIPVDVIERWLQVAGIEGARRLARHLPIPFIDADGNVVVPSLTASIVEQFGDDERVFNEFVAGMHFFAGYTDELRIQYARRLRVAHALLTHPLAPIRRWALVEEEYAHRLMEQLEEQEEERYIEM